MMVKKVLVLFEDDLYQRRGSFNAVISRTKFLIKNSNYNIDILLLATYEPWLVRKLRHTTKREKISQINIDGVSVHIDWHRFSLIDYVLSVRMHLPELFHPIHNKKVSKSLINYDLIIAHSYSCGLIAKQANEITGTPYTITWHGSDIHTEPFINPTIFKSTRNLIENADINFFVSKTLLETSDKITSAGVKRVLYNGYSPIFKRYSDFERLSLRKKWNVEDKKVVVFAGNFFEVKNPFALPKIFNAIYKQFKNVEFWLIGNGKYQSQIEDLSKDLPVRFWGGQSHEAMPDFFNASDVLILPSINEGLPLTVVEALASGCNVVGSLVGGIPEVIGEDNCVSLSDSQFVNKFAKKVLRYLMSPIHIEQSLKPDFDWENTSKREIGFIESIINCTE